MSDRPIRFGVMCGGPLFQRWQAACLSELLSLPGVELALAIQPAVSKGSGLKARARRHPLGLAGLSPANLPFTVYHALVFRPRSAERVDMSARFADVPVMRCQVRREGRFSEYFEDRDLAAIRDLDLDFIMRFAFGIIRGGILDAARYGVWSYHHGDEQRYRGGPSGFWEIHNRDPVTGAMLQRLTDRLDAGIVLRKGFFKTDPSSLARTRDQVFFGSVGWPAQLCAALQRGDQERFTAAPSSTDAPIYTWPTARHAIRFFATTVGTRIGHAKGRLDPLLRAAGWNVGIVTQPAHTLLQGGPPTGVWWLPQRRGRFAADAFALQREGRLHLFYEEYAHRREVGVIVHRAIGPDRTLDAPCRLLETGIHTSYPYVFEHAGETYLIPETGDAREIALYRATSFPHLWTREATLLTGAGYIDPTVIYHDDRWWLFATLQETNPNLNLHIWHATDLRGPWRAHADNPVKTDVRSARPAGTPFVYQGKLYRPAQDASEGYGRRIVINRVDVLTPETFAEEPVAAVTPDVAGGYPDGIHTLCAVGDITVIDGNRQGFAGAVLSAILARGLARFSRVAPADPDRVGV